MTRFERTAPAGLSNFHTAGIKSDRISSMIRYSQITYYRLNERSLIMGIVVTLICGALAGWIAGKLMNSDNGTVLNTILGLAGGVVGNVVLGIIGISGRGLIGGTIVAVFGACLLIWIAGKIKK